MIGVNWDGAQFSPLSSFREMNGRTFAAGCRLMILALPFSAGLKAQTILSSYTFEAGYGNNASGVATGLTVAPFATNGIIPISLSFYTLKKRR